jgi:hypothetical protein
VLSLLAVLFNLLNGRKHQENPVKYV